MYIVILFEIGQPHIDENILGVYSTQYHSNATSFIEAVDLDTCEVVFYEENDTEMSN